MLRIINVVFLFLQPLTNNCFPHIISKVFTSSFRGKGACMICFFLPVDFFFVAKVIWAKISRQYEYFKLNFLVVMILFSTELYFSFGKFLFGNLDGEIYHTRFFVQKLLFFYNFASGTKKIFALVVLSLKWIQGKQTWKF